ncbi:unnamed protein product, partial [Discosporangium mesarthrocarpum]
MPATLCPLVKRQRRALNCVPLFIGLENHWGWPPHLCTYGALIHHGIKGCQRGQVISISSWWVDRWVGERVVGLNAAMLSGCSYSGLLPRAGTCGLGLGLELKLRLGQA